MDGACAPLGDPQLTLPCQTCSQGHPQVGSELPTSLEGNVTPPAAHRPLSGALPSPGEQVPSWCPLLWTSAPDQLIFGQPARPRAYGHMGQSGDPLQGRPRRTVTPYPWSACSRCDDPLEGQWRGHGHLVAPSPRRPAPKNPGVAGWGGGHGA